MHSYVGVSGCPAGIAMEEGAELVVFLQVEAFFSVADASRSSGDDLLPRPRSQLAGVVVRGFPFVGGRGTADPASTSFVQVVGGFSERSADSDGVGLLRRPAIGDFPSARGSSCSKVMESCSGGAPPTAPRRKTSSTLQEGWTVILIFWRTFL